MPWRRRPQLSLPRSSSLRIHLSLLGWFLREELPKKHPEIFPASLTITPCGEQGWSNFAFFATGHDNRRYMVRMRAEAADVNPALSAYQKESWILQRLDSEIPHAQALANGIGYVRHSSETTPYSWFIQSCLEGTGADQRTSQLDPLLFRQKLGKLARRINQISCSGFGTRFNGATATFCDTDWPTTLAREVADAGFDVAVSSGVLSASGAACIKRRIKALERLAITPTLYHVDFAENWSNVLVTGTGEITGIIDWELAGAGPALHYELANVLYVMLRDGRSKLEIERLFGAFLSGYGLSWHDYREHYAHDVETLILLLAVQKLRRYVDLDRQGKLREHRWRVAFFERCGDLIRLGARLSECEGQKILITL